MFVVSIAWYELPLCARLERMSVDISADLVTVRREGRVAWLRLNRPEKLNALSGALIDAATDAFARLGAEREISVIVLTGAGRTFSAGADVQELRALDPGSARAFISRLHGLLHSVRHLDQIVIAAVRGHCYGGALELAAACDLRIAAEGARFGMPEIRVGIPSVIEAALLVPLMGLGRAADLVFTGEVLSAPEAERAGLVTRVVPETELDDAADRLARQIAAYSGPALRLQKRLVRTWQGADMDAAIEAGIDALVEAYASPNPREAFDAFLARREPRFPEL
jgi:enoyl-CoA hydratase/carnithine racemase